MNYQQVLMRKKGGAGWGRGRDTSLYLEQSKKNCHFTQSLLHLFSKYFQSSSDGLEIFQTGDKAESRRSWSCNSCRIPTLADRCRFANGF